MKRVFAAGAGTFLFSASLAVIAAPAAHASTLNVPGSYRTISAAIAAAHSGDTVLVAPGTYRESLTIIGKNVAVRSSGGASRTIIAAPGGRSPVTFQNVGRTAQLWGFRIVSGNAPSGQGGGVTAANNASPTIAYNQIVSNRSVDGGGILAYGSSSPDIAYNTIQSNHVSVFGGGIFAYMGSNPTIRGNVISGNTATDGGGGIYLEANSGNRSARAGGTVTQNHITGNSAGEAGGGIMLRTGEVAVISANVITGNTAAYGGGIHVETNGSGPYITGNTINSNSAPTSSAYPGSGSGGGISVFGQSTPTIVHNSIAGNRSSQYGGGLVLAEGSNSRVSANNIKLNATTNSGAFGGGVFVGNASTTFWNNIVQRNTGHEGGGLALAGTGTQIILNNSFVSNQTSSGSTPLGGGIFIGKQGVSVKNNLFLHNANYQVFDASTANAYANNLADVSVLGDFYSYHTGGNTTFARLNGNATFPAVQNIDGNAAVVNGPGGNYMLTAASAAVNRARASGAPTIDYRNAHRPYGGGYDIGAYEYTG